MPLDRVQLSADLAALDRYNESEVTISGGYLMRDPRRRLPPLGGASLVRRLSGPPTDQRGQGLGTLALQRMLAVIARFSDSPVFVSPGGYADNKDQQYRFYLQNGFKCVEDEPDLLVWTRT